MDGVQTLSPVSVHPPRSGIVLACYRAANDLFQGLGIWRIWSALSWQEFKNNYHRSLFGILWVTLSFGGFVFIKIAIFSALLTVEDAQFYDAYLVTGYFIWVYLSQSVSGASDTFVVSKGWIQSEPLPLSTYVYKSAMRESYTLFLTSIVVVVSVLVIGYPVQALGLAYALMAVPFYFLTAIFVKFMLGTISTRFRDISHLVKAIMMPMLFLTPVFWLPEQMGGLMKYLWWNPFYHFIEIFRSPLLTNSLPVTSWIFALTVFGIVSVCGLVLFTSFRQRIVFWL